jgi:20S proteasome alpha/beta subunit
VTIVAGFKCKEGVVLCADTQETIEPLKRHVPKLRIQPNKDFYGGDLADELMVAFAGAGDGPFIDKLTSRAWEDAQVGTNIEEVSNDIEKSIKNTYKEYGQIYQTGYCPQVSLLYGIKMHGKSLLFRADGPVVNEKDTYDCAGTGLYLSNFLCSRMYRNNLTLEQATILAAYVLFQAKEHVDGCGGQSHVAILKNNGGSGMAENLTGITKQIQLVDRNVEQIVLSAADLTIDEEKYNGDLTKFIKLLTLTRKMHADDHAQWDALRRALSGEKP